jgi:NAD(P)-dependent dehydrogenase (short-subunit alcohol dehydrogenase family)
VVDQRDIGALRSTVPQIEAELGGIDILFAKRRNSSLSSSARDGRSRLTYSNRREPHSTANAIRTFAPALVRRGGGRIIVTSSTQGRHGTVYGAAYSASKLGIIGLMKSAALELGRYGIPVNALIPGLIDTALTRHEERYAQALQVAGKAPSGDVAIDEEEAKTGLQTKSLLDVPWIGPDDIAQVVVFSHPMPRG